MSKSIQDRPTISQIEPVYDHVPSPSPSTLLRSTHTEYLTPIANGPTATTAITTSYQSLDHLISPVLPLPPPNLMKATRSARRIVTTPPHPVEAHKPALREDLSWSVKGMYRLLDLITEQGSSGIVHKVVVPQQSLRAFVNTLSPGAYSSITNVNFQVLDNLMFKPIGIYGSKEEIVRFLYKISAVDKKVAQMLLKKQNDSMTKDASPILRTGLYVVRSFASTASEQAYILYWPEDTTWDDQTASPIQRNRVMFMKYLTRLCDQLVCLLSKAHSQAIIWGDDDAKRNDGDDVLSYSRNEDPEQLLRSEAIKIKDQEENIVARPGFMINTTLLTKKSAPPGVHTNPRISSPIPLNGEEVQGFMTAKFRPAKTFLKPFIHDRQSASQIRLLLGDAALCLSETLGDTSLKTMLDLIAQFPEECKAWERKRNEITKRFRKDRARREVKSEERELGTLRSEFIREIEGLSRQRSRSRRFICVDSFEIKREHFYSPDYYLIHGRQESLQEEMIEYHVYLLRFPIEEKQILQLDPSYVPTPVLDEQSSQPWRVSSQTPVNYVHLLKGDQIIVVIVDSEGWALVFVDHLSRIHTVIQQRSCVERLNLGTISQTFIFAFDESKDMLAIYASARMQLHIVSLNAFLGAGLSGLRRLSQWRSRSSHEPIDLLQFYHHRVSIIHLCFVHGSQEILFVDSSARAAVFSLTTPTPQPRYPSSRLEIDYRLLQSKTPPLQLPQVPHAIYSSPDGSHVLFVLGRGGKSTVIAHRWSTFGSVDGTPVTLPDFRVDLRTALLTSIVNRNNIHLIGLDLTLQFCRSFVLDFTYKQTASTSRKLIPEEPISEASLRIRNAIKAALEMESKTTSQEPPPSSSSDHSKPATHNCLIDCHSDVWKRFPVVPAVKHRAITSPGVRQQKALVFVTDNDQLSFPSHFSDIVRSFENTSRKQTDGELGSIAVSTCTFASFARQFRSNPDWAASRFRAGEWLVDFLCLIPIQIAITHKSRFIPLNDGVLLEKPEPEQMQAEASRGQGEALRHAVDRVEDGLSLGWYESIFQSYWSSKPVKVISSMGEQSVGKSFALNHLVDSAFAGSAMRTTDGVWMSLSLTDDAVIVALDFQGVQSPEHSDQEDMLLVLFSTAISNLVLFRNDFALTRDITGLFKPFQLSASILDPSSNPSLFQSTLVVIIKDVTDSDRDEVTKEFSLTLEKLVEERGYNFITHLHRGGHNIIPWPAIESKEFYTLFGSIKQRLDQQPTSHQSARQFLHTLKILMAELKSTAPLTLLQKPSGGKSPESSTDSSQGHFLRLQARAAEPSGISRAGPVGISPSYSEKLEEQFTPKEFEAERKGGVETKQEVGQPRERTPQSPRALDSGGGGGGPADTTAPQTEGEAEPEGLREEETEWRYELATRRKWGSRRGKKTEIGMEVEEWQLEVYHDTLEESAILDAEGGVATGQIPEIALPEDERSYGKRRESVVEAPGAEADIQDLEESLQAREEDLRKQLEAVRQRREAIRQRGSVVGRRVPGLRQQLLASSTERELWEQRFGMTTQELEPQDSEMEVESDMLSLSSQYTVRSVVSYKERVNRRPVPRDRFTDFPTME